MLEGKKIEEQREEKKSNPKHNNMTKVEKGRSVKQLAEKGNVGINKIQKAKKIAFFDLFYLIEQFQKIGYTIRWFNRR